MKTPTDIIRTYGIRPRRNFSQSFLVDPHMIQKIVSSCKISKDDTVVEIGSGIGVMTRQLASIAKRVIAVEIDPEMMAPLSEQLSGSPGAEIHAGDILKFDFNEISSRYQTKIKVVGNVPYHISSPVIFRLLDFRNCITDFTLMLQKEVVERLVSPPGNKTYGVPSVLVQMYADMDRLFNVPPACFHPRPKVESSIVRGIFRKQPVTHLDNEEVFSRAVKAAFAQRRKMLINTLRTAQFLEGVLPDVISQTLNDTGIDPARRGETLSVEEFGHMSNALSKLMKNPTDRR